MFLVEGFLSELHVELGTENLLTRIDKHYRGKAVLTAAGAAVGDLFGQAATAASLVMYDGEDTQNFACLIDGRVVCGQFGGAEWLKAGRRVKAVVSERGHVLYAIAIMDESEGLLWITHAWGAKAEAAANWKIAGWSASFASACIAVTDFAVGPVMSTHSEGIAWGIGASALISVMVALWANRDMQQLAEPSTRAFRLLGFEHPAEVNLNSYQLALIALHDCSTGDGAGWSKVVGMSECRRRNVYCYQRALREGKLAISASS